MIYANAAAVPGTEDEDRVQELARQRLSGGCSYAFCFREIEFEFADGILTLRGRVPSFYLKQVLQTRLMDMKGVTQIRNEVHVVNSAGLSSVRPR